MASIKAILITFSLQKETSIFVVCIYSLVAGNMPDLDVLDFIVFSILAFMISGKNTSYYVTCVQKVKSVPVFSILLPIPKIPQLHLLPLILLVVCLFSPFYIFLIAIWSVLFIKEYKSL